MRKQAEKQIILNFRDLRVERRKDGLNLPGLCNGFG